MTTNRDTGRWRALWEVLLVSTRLGLTSFGGPIAHLGYYHAEYVERRRWLDEQTYADLVALGQFLPGPASSQVGIGIGLLRAGLLGGFVAWLGFTLPSAIALVLFAYLLKGYPVGEMGWIHGLKVTAVAVVAHAVLGMGRRLASDRQRATLAVLAAGLTLLWPSALSQVVAILLAGVVGWWLYRGEQVQSQGQITVPVGRGVAITALTAFFALLLLLPFLRQLTGNQWIALFDGFYRPGALVFGGGHVVLPLLEREVVAAGWVTPSDFLAGYGATQAVPGPLFTFSAYLGVMQGGLVGAVVALVAIFLPAFLLIVGALPFWNGLRANPTVQGALVGVNAAVVGILLGALYHPIWTSAILTAADFVLAAALFLMLQFWRLPPWLVVLAGAVGGGVLAYLS